MVCGCGNSFTTRSTKESGHIVVEVCSQCHPFYTGKQKILDSGGRVARFEKRYGKRTGAKADAAERHSRQASCHHRRPSARRCARGRASVCVQAPSSEDSARGRTMTQSAPAVAIDAVLAEHADLERQLSDPELHGDAGNARRVGSGSPNWHRSWRPTASWRPPAAIWRPPANSPPTTRRSPMRSPNSRPGSPNSTTSSPTCWRRATRTTPTTSCSRSSPARAARSRRCSPPTWPGCTSATPSGTAGR